VRKKLTAVVLAGTLGLAGVTGAVIVTPSLAAAATGTQAPSVGDRLTAIKDALKGLVTDGTLTQEQADKVAETLNDRLPMRGPGHGGHIELSVAAETLGMSAEELLTELRSATSLAAVAEARGVERATLIDKLVAAAEEQLAQAVADGRLTQAQADERKAGLRAEITEHVDRVGGLGRGHGFGGGRGGGGIDLSVAAEALGLTAEELATELRSGKSLADVADAEGVEKATLIDKLVAAVEERLAQDVEAGRLTQAQADDIKADLRTRITEKVDRAGGFGRGHGHHGRFGPGDGAPPDGTPTIPSPEATTSSYDTATA